MLRSDSAATAQANTGEASSKPAVVHVPLRFRRRGGRKLVVVASAEEASTGVTSYADPALLKALARAFRWQRRIDNGEVASINELAEAEGLSPTYVGRVLRLTLLAPEIVEEILDGDDVGDGDSLEGSVPDLWERRS